MKRSYYWFLVLFYCGIPLGMYRDGAFTQWSQDIASASAPPEIIAVQAQGLFWIVLNAVLVPLSWARARNAGWHGAVSLLLVLPLVGVPVLLALLFMPSRANPAPDSRTHPENIGALVRDLRREAAKTDEERQHAALLAREAEIKAREEALDRKAQREETRRQLAEREAQLAEREARLKEREATR